MSTKKSFPITTNRESDTSFTRATGKQTSAESADGRGSEDPPLLVFSHLRWHFITQRPQHLLKRAAQSRSVYFWEEPCIHGPSDPEPAPSEGGTWELLQAEENTNITVIRSHFDSGSDVCAGQRRLLDQFLSQHCLDRFDTWYYTPMALTFSSHLHPDVAVYDCMDELSAFLGAPTEIIQRERELFRIADVVFTGGQSLYEAKRSRHPNVHFFPSSIDVSHFARARTGQLDPLDQAAIPHPRAGFFGVLDERFDASLVSEVAVLRPEMNFIFIGPVVKIDPKHLPKLSNVYYLGAKSYAALPSYLSGWDVTIMPFARNESTRFISPTKTPEYLAAGKRVISTPIPDVIAGYQTSGLVEIAATASEFAAALDSAVSAGHDPAWSKRVEDKLSESSWDRTWAAMHAEMEDVRNGRTTARVIPAFVPSVKMSARVSSNSYDYLIVGAGFAGSVVAERLASQLGKRVLVIDKRPHIGGNTYDCHNEHGILVHQYGPHIFHTSSEKVVTYLSQFTEWRPYEHRVLAHVDGKLLPIPINLDTINHLYGLELDSAGMERFLAERVEPRSHIRTSEDIVVSRLGRELYEKFFRNYTRKQWGLDPSELDSSVAGRIPVRFNRDDRYFSDSFQAMPLKGFTRMFERILTHPKITVMLSTDYRHVIDKYPKAKIVYTGPIDEFFDHRFGHLPYRSLRFEHRTYNQEQFQPVAVVNYPNDQAYTRVTEFKHLTGQEHQRTSVVYEFPTDEGDPYYPIPRPENTELFERYRALAAATKGVYFCGRLANYRYFNMDQVVAQALHVYDEIAENETVEINQLVSPASLRIGTEPVRTVSI